METQEKQKNVRFFHTKTARLLMVVVLILLLLIPLQLMNGLVKERENRQEDVVNEISEKWGKEILIYGPIIKIPYTEYTETEQYNKDTKETIKIRKVTIKQAYFFPEKLQESFKVSNKPLYRGNYQAVVFNTTAEIKAEFVQFDFTKLEIPKENILWEKASIIIKTTNLKSIQNEVFLKMNNKNYQLEPVFESGSNSLQTLQTNYINLSNIKGKKSIDFHLNYNGSKSIKTIPIGKVTTTKMESNWQDPSFTGNFLPNSETKKISENGFEADWKILHINRPFGQSFLNGLPNLNSYSYGVDFKILNNDYQQNERASKYGILVISLTFLVFFMVQIINDLRVHIIQYALIGAALVLFYSLLLSITEHSSFTFAYFISSLSVILMVTLYSWSFFKKFSHIAIISSSLITLYVFIYIIIQLDSYALLAGSIGLFVILALIMYFSRKVNWEVDE
jgi:inner membrane protein